MSAAGLLVVGAAVAIGHATRGGDVFPRDVVRAVGTVTAIVGARTWVNPLPAFRDRVSGRVYKPTQSDGWGSGRDDGSRLHRGSDLMYQRRAVTRSSSGKVTGGDLQDRFPVYAQGHAGLFFCPPGLWCGAAADGQIWSAGLTPTGWSVVISHGAPWATYYTHFERLHPNIAATARGASKQRVKAGDPIGEIGISPRDGGKIRHLHFAMWKGGGEESAVDPWPLMKGAPVVREQTA